LSTAPDCRTIPSAARSSPIPALAGVYGKILADMAISCKVFEVWSGLVDRSGGIDQRFSEIQVCHTFFNDKSE
jgi:hypothetical protein